MVAIVAVISCSLATFLYKVKGVCNEWMKYNNDHAYHSNKLSHAYLFEGDDAQTMKQVAINFAKLILCQTDSQCETKVSTYNHPDFMYISTTENAIKKEQVEQLVRHMNQLPRKHK